jgi:hypothetical protein
LSDLVVSLAAGSLDPSGEKHVTVKQLAMPRKHLVNHVFAALKTAWKAPALQPGTLTGAVGSRHAPNQWGA